MVKIHPQNPQTIKNLILNKMSMIKTIFPYKGCGLNYLHGYYAKHVVKPTNVLDYKVMVFLCLPVDKYVLIFVWHWYNLFSVENKNCSIFSQSNFLNK